MEVLGMDQKTNIQDTLEGNICIYQHHLSQVPTQKCGTGWHEMIIGCKCLILYRYMKSTVARAYSLLDFAIFETT